MNINMVYYLAESNFKEGKTVGILGFRIIPDKRFTKLMVGKELILKEKLFSRCKLVAGSLSNFIIYYNRQHWIFNRRVNLASF